MTIRLRFLVVLGGALVLLGVDSRVTVAGGAPVFWLGGGGAPCNFSSLTIAIGAVPDGAVIRIAGNQSYDAINVVINNKSLTLEGGWADCAGTPSSARPILNGAAADQPVIRVQSAATARTVRLQQLQISGGLRSGIEVDGLIELQLADSVVSDNQGMHGGGLSVNGVSPALTRVRLEHSTIGNPGDGTEDGNLASVLGGGLYCVDARIHVGASQIRGNTAGHHGGGLYLNRCELRLLESTLASAEFGPLNALIANNQSASFGGGVFARDGSDVRFQLSGGSAVQIDGNTATRGGGVYLTDFPTSLLGDGLRLTNNTGEHFGGAAFVNSGALLHLRRGENWGSACYPVAPCSRITGNEVVATTTAAASAVQVHAATITLDQTEIAGNLATISAQAVIYATGASLVRIGNSLIHGNDSGPGRIVQIDDGGSHFGFNGSTIVGNSTGSPLIRVSSSDGTTQLNFINGIIWQPGTTIVGAIAGDSVTGTCMNAHENSSLNALTHDPAFADPAAGNYSLHVSSPNIDACTDSFAGTGRDILGRFRPIDMGFGNDAAASYNRGVINPDSMDRGAYEMSDQIFADGFELQENGI